MRSGRMEVNETLSHKMISSHSSVEGKYEEEKDPFLAYSQIYGKSVGFITTLFCPIKCRHCGLECGPDRNEELPLDLLLQCIRDAAESNIIRAITLTGGEPFYDFDKLKAVLALTEGYSLLVNIVTSGWWARSVDYALKLINSLPDFSHLCISADMYHEEHIPLQYVKNACLAGLQLNKRIGVSLRVWDLEADPYIKPFYDYMGENLIKKITVLLGPLVPYGRAKTLRQKPRQWKGSVFHPCMFASVPSVLTDNRVIACCNDRMWDLEGEPLKLGDVSRESLDAILKRGENNALVHYLRIWGPRSLAEIAIRNGYKFNFRDYYQDYPICGVCIDLLSDPEIVDFLNEKMNEPSVKKNIAFARAIKFGELHALESI